MVTNKDKAVLKEMMQRIGVADFLATVGNMLAEKAAAEDRAGNVGSCVTDKAAELVWKASEL